MKRRYKIYIIIIMMILISNSIKVYAKDEISVDSKAALIVEINTGKIIYEKNKDDKNYPASVTKILTAILTIENCDLDETVTVSENSISHIPSGYVTTPLYVGEEIKVKDLLYALMLKSANDAAYVLAEYVGGSVEKFSDMMNEKAKELGCENSHFVNPNGIHNPEHYTTAYDMYLISDYAMKNETFAEIVSTYKYIIPATNKYANNNRIMMNTNLFINPSNSYYNKNVKGIKTGTTIQAGNCLITDSEENGLEFITVVLGAETSDSKFSETKEMIQYSFENYKITKLHEKGDVIKNIEVEKATKKTKNLKLVTSDKIEVMNNIETNIDKIEPDINLNESIIAPIEKGQEIGTIKYTVEDIEYSAKLLAENDVEKKTYYVEILIGVGIITVIIICIIIFKRLKIKNK